MVARLNDEQLAELAASVADRLRAQHSAAEREAKLRRRTVRQHGEAWTSGELLRDHGRLSGLKLKRSVEQDAYRLEAHVYPHIGATAVVDVTEQDIERVMRDAEAAAQQKRGKSWRPNTRLQLWQLLSRLFALAVRPCRLRRDNPVTAWSRPRGGGERLYPYLYPAELLQLMACREVPVVRRVFYGAAAACGLRLGSLIGMPWRDVDRQHGVMTARVSKTGYPVKFAIVDQPDRGYTPGLVSLLTRWHAYSGAPGPAEPVFPAGPDLGPKRLAEAFRADLRAAGVQRTELFEHSDELQRIRCHDLRATFVTWAIRAGIGRGWISDRTGHLTDEMIRRYTRAARTLEDLRIVPFPPLADAVGELAEMHANVVQLADRRRG
jgi:integrase